MLATKRHQKLKMYFLLLLCFLCPFVTTSDAFADPKPPKPGPQANTVIIVNERALVGPNSAAQLRGGRLFLPVATIAQALGDTLSSDSTQRIVTIRRQNGTTAVFNAPLNEVRSDSHCFRHGRPGLPADAE
jgi:copper amine oxidase-like protein